MAQDSSYLSDWSLFGEKHIAYGPLSKNNKWLELERHGAEGAGKSMFLQVSTQCLQALDQHPRSPLLVPAAMASKTDTVEHPPASAPSFSGSLQHPTGAHKPSSNRHIWETFRHCSLPWGWREGHVPSATPSHNGKIRMETQSPIFVLNFHWLKKYVNAKMLTLLSHYGLLCNYFFDSSWRLNWRHNGLLCNDISAEFFLLVFLFSLIFFPSSSLL